MKSFKHFITEVLDPAFKSKADAMAKKNIGAHFAKAIDILPVNYDYN